MLISFSCLKTIFFFFFRQKIKCVFNQQFGSVFRTYHNPTYFSRRLFRFADIYMSSLTNLLNYSVNHTFYPRRGVMPHEYTSLFVWTLNCVRIKWDLLRHLCTFFLCVLSDHNYSQLLSWNFFIVWSIHIFFLTLRWLMSYIYGAPILDVSRSHTTAQHSR